MARPHPFLYCLSAISKLNRLPAVFQNREKCSEQTQIVRPDINNISVCLRDNVATVTMFAERKSAPDCRTLRTVFDLRRPQDRRHHLQLRKVYPVITHEEPRPDAVGDNKRSATDTAFLGDGRRNYSA